MQPFPGDRCGQDRPAGLAVEPRSSRSCMPTGADTGASSRAPPDRWRPRSPSAGRSGRSGQAAWCSSRTGRRAPGHSRNWGRCPRHSGRAGTARRRANRPGVRLRSSIRPASSSRPAKCWVRRWFWGSTTGRNGRRTGRNPSDSAFCTSGTSARNNRPPAARPWRRQFGRRAVFVGGAQEQHLMAARTGIAGIQVGRQHAAHQIAQMLDPVDIGDRRGDQNARHAVPRLPKAGAGLAQGCARRQCGRKQLPSSGRAAPPRRDGAAAPAGSGRSHPRCPR
jgi:hypothetical protein